MRVLLLVCLLTLIAADTGPIWVFPGRSEIQYLYSSSFSTPCWIYTGGPFNGQKGPILIAGKLIPQYQFKCFDHNTCHLGITIDSMTKYKVVNNQSLIMKTFNKILGREYDWCNCKAKQNPDRRLLNTDISE